MNKAINYKDAILAVDIWDERIQDNVEYKMINVSISDAVTDCYSAEPGDLCSLASIRKISESGSNSSPIIILKISHSKDIRLKLINQGDIFSKETLAGGKEIIITRKPGLTSVNKNPEIKKIVLMKDF